MRSCLKSHEVIDFNHRMHQTDAERKEIEEHLRGCEDCNSRISADKRSLREAVMRQSAQRYRGKDNISW